MRRLGIRRVEGRGRVNIVVMVITNSSYRTHRVRLVRGERWSRSSTIDSSFLAIRNCVSLMISKMEVINNK